MENVQTTITIQDQKFETLVDEMQRDLRDSRRVDMESMVYGDQASIYKVPSKLARVNRVAVEPEFVSIGPYHHGKNNLTQQDSYKWRFLNSLISRTEPKGVRLWHYMSRVKELESRARECYSESIPMPSDDLIVMMVLDACFIIEVLQQVCGSEAQADVSSPIVMAPWLIPVIIRDLLKMENQIPFFLLQDLFDLSVVQEHTGDPLTLLALKFFSLAFPRGLETSKTSDLTESKHLLDLFHLSLLPSALQSYRPSSSQSIQCVRRLRESGIKFRPRKTNSFLDIKFKSAILEIPPITINNVSTTTFLNCVAWEQCHPLRPTCFSTYISFMSCLVNSYRDIAFLCDDGIITNLSGTTDVDAANFFKKLGETVVFNIRECYLSKQFKDMEAYYGSNRATLVRNYFSSPWSFISVVSAIVLLVLTGLQTVMSILSYKQHG